MPLHFERPVGAIADVRELEYISALHQTGVSELRAGGSVHAVDVVHFLASRYGIRVTEEEVKATIFKDFGGGGVCSKDGESIDLVEMLAMLLIPLLLKARHGLDIPDQIIQSTADEEAPLRKNNRKSHVGNKYDVSDLNCNASNENDDNRCINSSNDDCVAEKQNSEDSTTESFLSAIDFQDESTNTSMIPSEVPSNVSPLPAPLSTRSVRGVCFSSSVNHHSYPLNNGGQWNANTNRTSSILRIQESTNQKNSLIEEDSFFEINSSLIPGSRSMRSSGNKSVVNTDTINDSGASSSDQWCDNALLKCNNPNGNNNSINKVSDEVANINHDDPSKRKYDQADFGERWPPENLISKVLHFLLKDVMGNAYASSSAQSPNFKSSSESEESAPSLWSAGTAEFEPPILTVELMKDILLFYGEREMALNDNLVREMIWAAAGSSGHIHDDNDDDILPLVRLDECAFARALTGDVQKHDIGSENKNSTNYFDVFKTLYSTKKSNDFVTRMTMEDTTRECANASDMIDDSSANVVTTTASVATELGELGLESSLHCRTKEDQLRCQNVKVDNEEAIRPVERIFTFPSIDYTVDSFRNKTFVVTLWVTYVVSYFAYLFGYSGAVDVDACGDTFGCIIGIGILKWIEVMVELSILGTLFLWLSSLGNTVYPTHPFYILIGIISVVFFTIVPFLTEMRVGDFVSTEKHNNGRKFLYFISFAGGCFLIFLKILSLIDALLPLKFLMEHNRVARIFLSSNVRNEAKLKRAAGFKVNRLVRNALDIHNTVEENDVGSSDVANSSTASVSGSGYGKALLNFAKLSDKTVMDGGLCWAWRNIWNGQLYEKEGIWLSTRIIAGNFGQIVICLVFPLFGILFCNSETYKPHVQKLEQTEQWRMIVPAAVGILLGFLAVLNLAIILLPSTIKTIMQFRYGCLGSLNDNVFLDYRIAVEQQSLLFGSIFWGALYTSILVAFFFGGVLLLLFHPVTSGMALPLVASLIGLSITALLKLGILLCFRSNFYAAFYRKKPAHANFVGIILESWNLGLTPGFLVMRSIKLIVAALLFIGRIDIPLIADSANRILGPLKYDGFPVFFRKEILAHEAHRHPYIERLGMIYMTKLRFGEGFGREAGTCWRLLFAFTLMPWMRKYRLDIDENEVDITYFKFGKTKSGFSGRMPLQTLIRLSKEAKETTDLAIAGSKFMGSKKEGIDDREEQFDNTVIALAEMNSSLVGENEILRRQLDALKKSVASSGIQFPNS